MTNADVPTLAMAELIENPVNPFTGKPINSEEKNAHEQFVLHAGFMSASNRNRHTFPACRWLSVKGNPWNLDNWTCYNSECVLDRHAAP